MENKIKMIGLAVICPLLGYGVGTGAFSAKYGLLIGVLLLVGMLTTNFEE